MYNVHLGHIGILPGRPTIMENGMPIFNSEQPRWLRRRLHYELYGNKRFLMFTCIKSHIFVIYCWGYKQNGFGLAALDKQQMPIP